MELTLGARKACEVTGAQVLVSRSLSAVLGEYILEFDPAEFESYSHEY